MKKHIITKILVAMFATVMFLGCGTLDEIDEVRTISTIQDDGNKYCIYDQRGKKVNCVRRDIGFWEGFGSDWVVVSNTKKIYLYNIKGKKYKTLSISSVGEVSSVGSESFVTRKNGKLITYDKFGKKISSRRER